VQQVQFLSSSNSNNNSNNKNIISNNNSNDNINTNSFECLVKRVNVRQTFNTKLSTEAVVGSVLAEDALVLLNEGKRGLHMNTDHF
jgi:hypothetical protein